MPSWALASTASMASTPNTARALITASVHDPETPVRDWSCGPRTTTNQQTRAVFQNYTQATPVLGRQHSWSCGVHTHGPTPYRGNLWNSSSWFVYYQKRLFRYQHTTLVECLISNIDPASWATKTKQAIDTYWTQALTDIPTYGTWSLRAASPIKVTLCMWSTGLKRHQIHKSSDYHCKVSHRHSQTRPTG